MRADILEKRVAEDLKAGKKPFFVGATAGTTVMGEDSAWVQRAVAFLRSTLCRGLR